MEDSKVFIYIVIGALYFIYSMVQKGQQKKQEAAEHEQAENVPPVSKPISPPAANPLEDIMREIQRKQLEAQRKQQAQQAKPVQTFQQKKPQKEILVREVKKAAMIEGASSYEPVYEREVTAEEKIERGTLKLKNEGVYRVQTMEEAQTASDADRDFSFDFDARQAFIGSVIFERKY